MARFAATACLFEAGKARRVSTSLENFTELLARTPVGAARMWYWRLTEAERAACWLVIVWTWGAENPFGYRTYDGPSLAFSPKDDWREVSVWVSQPWGLPVEPPAIAQSASILGCDSCSASAPRCARNPG